MAHPFVETKEMTVGYRGVPLIRDIALHVHRGEILTLIGPNGSGKSTILKSLIRQLALIGGTVYLDGKSLQTLPERDLARTMSVLLTEHVRPELMTCWDVAAAGRYPYTGRLGLLSDEDRAKVDEALALVGADELADRDFSCISDGQRQRIPETGDRFEKGERQTIFPIVGEHSVLPCRNIFAVSDNFLLHMQFHQRRRDTE